MKKIAPQCFVNLHVVFAKQLNQTMSFSVLQALYFYQIDGRGPCLAFEGIL